MLINNKITNTQTNVLVYLFGVYPDTYCHFFHVSHVRSVKRNGCTLPNYIAPYNVELHGNRLFESLDAVEKLQQ